MKGPADIFYPIRPIYSYLQETIFQPWFSSDPRTHEMFETKKPREHPSKQVHSEFLTFFFICTFLVVIICLVSKQPKERNNEEEEGQEEETERISSMPTINETVTESTASSICSVPVDSTEYTSDICPDCNDLSPSARINELIPSLNVSIRDHTFRTFPDVPDSVRSSYGSMLSVDEVPDLQQVQKKRSSGNQKHPPKKAKQARACLDRDWFVRRTRSGQVYGTYGF